METAKKNVSPAVWACVVLVAITYVLHLGLLYLVIGEVAPYRASLRNSYGIFCLAVWLFLPLPTLLAHLYFVLGREYLRWGAATFWLMTFWLPWSLLFLGLYDLQQEFVRTWMYVITVYYLLNFLFSSFLIRAIGSRREGWLGVSVQPVEQRPLQLFDLFLFVTTTIVIAWVAKQMFPVRIDLHLYDKGVPITSHLQLWGFLALAAGVMTVAYITLATLLIQSQRPLRNTFTLTVLGATIPLAAMLFVEIGSPTDQLDLVFWALGAGAGCFALWLGASTCVLQRAKLVQVKRRPILDGILRLKFLLAVAVCFAVALIVANYLIGINNVSRSPDYFLLVANQTLEPEATLDDSFVELANRHRGEIPPEDNLLAQLLKLDCPALYDSQADRSMLRSLGLMEESRTDFPLPNQPIRHEAGRFVVRYFDCISIPTGPWGGVSNEIEFHRVLTEGPWRGEDAPEAEDWVEKLSPLIDRMDALISRKPWQATMPLTEQELERQAVTLLYRAMDRWFFMASVCVAYECGRQNYDQAIQRIRFQQKLFESPLMELLEWDLRAKFEFKARIYRSAILTLYAPDLDDRHVDELLAIVKRLRADPVVYETKLGKAIARFRLLQTFDNWVAEEHYYQSPDIVVNQSVRRNPSLLDFEAMDQAIFKAVDEINAGKRSDVLSYALTDHRKAMWSFVLGPRQLGKHYHEGLMDILNLRGRPQTMNEEQFVLVAAILIANHRSGGSKLALPTGIFGRYPIPVGDWVIEGVNDDTLPINLAAPVRVFADGAGGVSFEDLQNTNPVAMNRIVETPRYGKRIARYRLEYGTYYTVQPRNAR